MKSLALILGLSCCGLLSGCATVRVAPVLPRGSGVHQVVNGSIESSRNVVRNLFREYSAMSFKQDVGAEHNADIVDTGSMIQLIVNKHDWDFVGDTDDSTARYKVFLSTGPTAEQTDAEFICEVPEGTITPKLYSIGCPQRQDDNLVSKFLCANGGSLSGDTSFHKGCESGLAVLFAKRMKLVEPAQDEAAKAQPAPSSPEASSTQWWKGK